MSMKDRSESSVTQLVNGWDKEVSPYHPGEVELHTRLGRAEDQEAMARHIHHSFIQESHRQLFQQLPFVIAGSVDLKGAPWAHLDASPLNFIEGDASPRTLQTGSWNESRF